MANQKNGGFKELVCVPHNNNERENVRICVVRLNTIMAYSWIFTFTQSQRVNTTENEDGVH